MNGVYMFVTADTFVLKYDYFYIYLMHCFYISLQTTENLIDVSAYAWLELTVNKKSGNTYFPNSNNVFLFACLQDRF